MCRPATQNGVAVAPLVTQGSCKKGCTTAGVWAGGGGGGPSSDAPGMPAVSSVTKEGGCVKDRASVGDVRASGHSWTPAVSNGGVLPAG